jgi:hypothetical protein
MSYDSQEYSVQDGSPYELYAFTTPADIDFYFTNNHEDVVHQSNTYTPLQITRDTFKLDAKSLTPRNLEITLPRKSPFGHMYGKPFSPPDPLIRIWRGHRGSSERKKIFFGDAVQYETQDDMLIVSAKPRTASLLSRPLVSCVYGAKCNHELFDVRCKVDADAHTWETTVSEVYTENSQFITVTSDHTSDDALVLGDIVVNGERRVIISNTANVIKVRYPFTSIEVGDAVTLIRGCNRKKETCKDVFDNYINFGGFSLTPERNEIKTRLPKKWVK